MEEDGLLYCGDNAMYQVLTSVEDGKIMKMDLEKPQLRILDWTEEHSLSYTT